MCKDNTYVISHFNDPTPMYTSWNLYDGLSRDFTNRLNVMVVVKYSRGQIGIRMVVDHNRKIKIGYTTKHILIVWK